MHAGGSRLTQVRPIVSHSSLSFFSSSDKEDWYVSILNGMELNGRCPLMRRGVPDGTEVPPGLEVEEVVPVDVLRWLFVPEVMEENMSVRFNCRFFACAGSLATGATVTVAVATTLLSRWWDRRQVWSGTLETPTCTPPPPGDVEGGRHLSCEK